MVIFFFTKALQVFFTTFSSSMIGFLVDEMSPSTIPFATSRIESSLANMEAVMMVPAQTFRSTAPVWFVPSPPSLCHVIMGRVIAQKIDCALIIDEVEDVKSTCSEDSFMPPPPSSCGSSNVASRSSTFCEYQLRSQEWEWADWKQHKPECLDWFNYEDSEPEFEEWYPDSDDSDYESVN